MPGGASLTCARWSPTGDDDGNGAACGSCEGFSLCPLLGTPALWALGGVGAMWTGWCSGAGTAGGWVGVAGAEPGSVTGQRRPENVLLGLRVSRDRANIQRGTKMQSSSFFRALSWLAAFAVSTWLAASLPF